MDKAFLVKLLETVKLQEKEKEERSRSRSSSGGDAALEEELEGIKEIREEYDPAIHVKLMNASVASLALVDSKQFTVKKCATTAHSPRTGPCTALGKFERDMLARLAQLLEMEQEQIAEEEGEESEGEEEEGEEEEGEEEEGEEEEEEEIEQALEQALLGGGNIGLNDGCDEALEMEDGSAAVTEAAAVRHEASAADIRNNDVSTLASSARVFKNDIMENSCYHGDNDDDKKDDDDDELDGELMDLEDDLDFYLHGRQISQEYNELKQILTRNREIDDASSHGIMMDGRNHVQYPSHSSPSQHLMGAGGLAGIHSQRVHDPSILEYIQQEYGGGIKPDINNSNLSFRSTHESNTTVKYPQQPPLFMMSRPLQVDSFTATSSTDSNYPSPKDMINDHILDADDVLDVPTQPQPSLKKPSKFKQFMSENSSIPSSPSFYSGSGSGSPSSSAEENYFNISASSDSLSSVSKCVSFCPTVKTNDGNNSTSSNNNSFASRNVKSSSSGYGGTSTAVKIEVVERPSMYPIVSSMSSSTSSFSASSSKKQSIFKAALLERTNSNIISK